LCHPARLGLCRAKRLECAQLAAAFVRAHVPAPHRSLLRLWPHRISTCLLACLLVPLSLLTGRHANAQQPVPADQTNETMQADDNGQGDDLTQTNDIISPENETNAANLSGGPQTNGAPTANNRGLRRRGRRRPDPGSAAVSFSQTATNASGRPAFSTFKIVADRNIFDPTRHAGYKPGPQPIVRKSDIFAYKGTLSYEKGSFAIFDGSSAEYQKALKVSDTIAGYQLLSVSRNSVKLASGTNEVELRIGMQMSRQEQGPWTPSEAAESYASVTPASPAASPDPSNKPPGNDPALSGPAADILKKLMQRRAQE